MNRKQHIVILIAALAIGYCFLIVPWVTYVPLDAPQGNMAETLYDYRLVNNPPEHARAIRPSEIVWMYQVQKIGFILALNALLLFLFRSKKTRRQFVCTPQAAPNAAF